MPDWARLAAGGPVTEVARALIETCPYLDLGVLQTDPRAGVNAIAEITVVERERLPAASCGGGYYDGDLGIIYIHPAGNRRDNFTILHELAHHMQQTHPEWGYVLLDLSKDARRKMEENVCNAIAARILLTDLQPADETNVDVSPAAVMADLHERSAASPSAVLQHIATIMEHRSKWILAVSGLDGTVMHSRATYGENYPPARGRAQPGFAALAEEARTGLVRRRFTEGVHYDKNLRLQDMYAHAALDSTGRCVFIALTPVARFGYGKLEAATYLCGNPGCERDEYALDREPILCDVCGEPKCPSCRQCECPNQRRSDVCGKCSLTISPYEKQTDTHECRR
ncbi:hypothetical protein CLV47_12315 [Antricoccus suffuscus]|uniref:IrrE N-terminal-like domain-containing protein n=2 Tax=Antricoccus suffuscus TaxID=1629062 RepID=A0A2T0ZEL3_9ACTN|nr:hypothetical protein CLV47_12315 [Antricoccus suffuscus]